MTPKSQKLWYNLRWTIIGSVICLILLIVSLSQFQSGQTRQEIASLLTDKITGRVQGEVSDYIDRIETLLHIVAKWGRQDFLEFDKPEQFMRGVRPVLEGFPNVAGLTLTSDGSNELSFLNTANGWIIVKQRQLKGAWFDYATKQEEAIVWLQPERLAPLESPTISGAITWSIVDKQTRGGAIGHVLVNNFYDFIADLEMRPGGRIYLIDGHGMALVRSGHAENTQQLFTASDDPALQSAIEAGVVDIDLNSPPLKITVAGKPWWVGVRPLNPLNPVHRLVVLMPEEAIVGALSSKRYTLPAIAGVLLLAGLAIILWQLKRYRLHLTDRAPWVDGTTDLQAGLEERIAAGETAHQEFKSTIRKNLRSGKIGKEIEKAWLKGVVAFLNTEGGVLFFGVDDEGEALGLDGDEFQSEDHSSRHVKSLINQNIGAEFTTYTHFELLSYHGKTIGMLACRPSPDPAFLKIGQDEEFYIRNGPASLCLSVSETLAYLKQRS